MDPASVYYLLALSVFELLAYILICSQGVGIIPQPKQTTVLCTNQAAGWLD